jgi:hypothetical protein
MANSENEATNKQTHPQEERDRRREGAGCPDGHNTGPFYRLKVFNRIVRWKLFVIVMLCGSLA